MESPVGDRVESPVETPVEKRWTTVLGARLQAVATIHDRESAMTAALRVCDARLARRAGVRRGEPRATVVRPWT